MFQPSLRFIALGYLGKEATQLVQIDRANSLREYKLGIDIPCPCRMAGGGQRPGALQQKNVVGKDSTGGA